MTVPVLSGPSAASGGPAPSLSAIEFAVLEGRARGLSYTALSAKLSYSYASIKQVGFRVIEKLEAEDITHAVFLACHAGILDGKPQRHGDHAGFAAHRYRGEEPCEECWDGERAYRSERRAARKAALRDAVQGAA